MLRAKEHTPTPSIVSIFGFTFESFKEFGGASCKASDHNMDQCPSKVMSGSCLKRNCTNACSTSRDTNCIRAKTIVKL